MAFKNLVLVVIVHIFLLFCFLKHHLGAATPENPEIELLRLELAEMKEKYEATVEENKKLKAKLVQYEPPQEEKRAE